jgi:fucose permease
VRIIGGLGLAIMGGGFLVFSSLSTDSSYWRFGLGALVVGVGIGLATTPATTAITSALPPQRQGIASAVNDLSREVGGAFGIAVLGSVLNSGYRHQIAAAAAQLPKPAADAVKSSIAAVAQAAPKHGAKGAALLNHAHHAFVDGVQSALLVASGVLFAAAVVVAVLAPRREDIEAAETQRSTRRHRVRKRDVSPA